MLIERFKIKRCVYNRSHGLADFKVNNLVKLISFFIGNKQFEPDQAFLIRSLRGRLVNKNKLRAFGGRFFRSEEHTSELQSRGHLVCRLLLEKKKYIE